MRSNLLFAKSVVLVEGDAEEILIPILVKRVFGISLDELGISLINIRSTGFENIAVLFHQSRIKKKCGIITDLDAAFIDTAALATDPPAVVRQKARALGAQTSGISRKAALETFCQNNTWVEAFFAPHTFEVDFVAAGNSGKVVSVIHDVYKDPATIGAAKSDLESGDVTRYGQRVLTMAANSGKGWFAILLGKMIDHHTIIPDYILKALFFAHGPLNREILYNVLAYRVHRIEESSQFGAPAIEAFRTQLRAYRGGTLDFNGIRNAMLASFTADEINSVLAGL